MGFFSQIVECATTAVRYGAKIVLGAAHVACQVVANVAEIVADGCKRVGRKVKQWSDKLKSVPKPQPQVLPPPEVQQRNKRVVEERIKPQVEQLFPGGVKKSAENMSPEERVRKIEDLVPLIAQSLGIQNVPEVSFFTSDPEETEDSKRFRFGAYIPNENKLEINLDMIASGNPELYAEQVSTVLHELTHCKQYEAVRAWVNKEQNTSGYSEEYLEILYNNIVNYVRPKENFEAYTKQPLEAEANNAESHLKNLACMNK